MHLRSITLCPDRYPTRDRYPFNLDIFREGLHLEFSSPITLFVGENGTGKSTLLRAICRSCGIFIWEVKDRPRFRPNPDEDSLHTAVDATWTDGHVPGSFFGSEIFRHFSEVSGLECRVFFRWCDLFRSSRATKYPSANILAAQQRDEKAIAPGRLRANGVTLCSSPSTM